MDVVLPPFQPRKRSSSEAPFRIVRVRTSLKTDPVLQPSASPNGCVVLVPYGRNERVHACAQARSNTGIKTVRRKGSQRNTWNTSVREYLKKKKRQKQNTFECNLKSQRRVSGYQTGKMFHSCSFQLRSILYATLDKQDCLKAVPDSLSNMFLNGKSSQILNIS